MSEVETIEMEVATTPVEETVETESSPEVQEAEKQSKRDRGAEGRIAKLTAQYKSELEARDAKINELSQRFESLNPVVQDEPQVETVEDLLKVMKQEIQKEFKNLFLEETKKIESQQVEQTLKQKTESFAAKLLEEYEDDFDGGIFVGDDKVQEELKAMMQVFQSNPNFWAAKIEKHGVSYLRNVIVDEDKTTQKKETVNKILEAADKAKITKNSGNNITDTVGAKFGTAGDLLRAMIKKGGSK